MTPLRLDGYEYLDHLDNVRSRKITAVAPGVCNGSFADIVGHSSKVGFRSKADVVR